MRFVAAKLWATGSAVQVALLPLQTVQQQRQVTPRSRSGRESSLRSSRWRRRRASGTADERRKRRLLNTNLCIVIFEERKKNTCAFRLIRLSEGSARSWAVLADARGIEPSRTSPAGGWARARLAAPLAVVADGSGAHHQFKTQSSPEPDEEDDS